LKGKPFGKTQKISHTKIERLRIFIKYFNNLFKQISFELNKNNNLIKFEGDL